MNDQTWKLKKTGKNVVKLQINAYFTGINKGYL